MQNTFSLYAEDDMEASVLWLAEVLLLLLLKTQKCHGQTDHISLQYMDCTQANDAKDKERVPEVEHDAQRGSQRCCRKKLKNRIKLNLSKWFWAEALIAICGAMHVVRGNYGIPMLREALQRLHHRIYINRFHSAAYVNLRGIPSGG